MPPNKQQQADVDFPIGTFTETKAARSAFYELVALSNEGTINLVAPTHELMMLPPFKALTIQRLEPSDGDLYPLPGGGGGKLGIVKRFLDRLKALRGISVIGTQRVDDRQDDAVWEYSCTVAVPMLDGSAIQIVKSRSVDMRDGGPDLIAALGKDWKTKQQYWQQARANGPALAESKAQNRAVREALGIESGMTKDAFMRPWAVVTLTAYADPSKMSQRAQDAAGMAILLGGNAMFGATAAGIYNAGTPQLVDRTPSPEELPAPTQDKAPAKPDQSPASKETKAELGKWHNGLGKEQFWAVAHGVFGEGNVPDASTITQHEAEMLLKALQAHNDDPPF